jgi:putative inorganic carbon (hco3(-)) transporter
MTAGRPGEVARHPRLRDPRAILLGALGLGLGLSITLAQTALALLAVRLIWRLATGRATMQWPLAPAFGGWIAASLLAATFSARPLESLASLKSLLLIAGFYVVLDALPDVFDAERWWSRLLVLMGIVGIVGVLQVALCPGLGPLEPVLGRLARKCHRAHAFYSIYMTLAGVLSLVLLATLPLLLAGGPRWRARGLAWLGGLAGLVATFVRGAWVGLLAGVVTLLGLMPRRRILAVGALLILAVAVFLVPAARRRAESIVDPTDPTARERWAMWASAIAVARDHPLTGVGPGQVKRVYGAYAAPEFRDKPRGHMHNAPLQILAARGVVGLAAWLVLFGAFFTRALGVLRALPPGATRERALVAGSVAAIAGFLVGGLTEHNFGDSEVVLVTYAVMALPFVVERSLSAARA